MSNTTLKNLNVLQALAKNSYNMSTGAIQRTNEVDIKTQQTETHITGIEEAMCDNYTEQTETNTTVEEALIEIYELIEGGN